MWFVYFGWIKRYLILEAVSMRTLEVIDNWDEYVGDRTSLPGVPYSQKASWHNNLLEQVARAHRQAAAMA